MREKAESAMALQSVVLAGPQASACNRNGPAKRLRVSAARPSRAETFRLRICVFAFMVAVDRLRGEYC